MDKTHKLFVLDKIRRFWENENSMKIWNKLFHKLKFTFKNHIKKCVTILCECFHPFRLCFLLILTIEIRLILKDTDRYWISINSPSKFDALESNNQNQSGKTLCASEFLFISIGIFIAMHRVNSVDSTNILITD